MPEPRLGALIKKQDATVSQEVAVARRVTSPRPVMHGSSGPSVNRNDILFALFKHKKKILLGTIVGLVAAAVIYFLYPSSFPPDPHLIFRHLLRARAGSWGLLRWLCRHWLTAFLTEIFRCSDRPGRFVLSQSRPIKCGSGSAKPRKR